MKKLLKTLVIIVLPLYIGFCVYLYFAQEGLIFLSEKLDKDHEFDFDGDFDEVYLEASDEKRIHGLWFKTPEPKGAVLYLHGNAGTVDDFGNIAHHYTNLNHDIFMIDYRGYGKSEGEIFSEEQFYSDVQLAYDKLKTVYEEDEITVIGYSVGTASAAMLAANNNPRQLILQAPYYSVVDMTERNQPIAPIFLLKYKFRTNRFIPEIKAPITVFHGDMDEKIYFGSALKLQKKFKHKDRLVTLKNHDHHDFEENETYLKELQVLLK